MKTTFIYSLSDPDTKEIRYIGKANNLKCRLWCHIHEAKYDLKNLHKCNWINSLLKMEKKPVITIIEEVLFEDWKIREIYWIHQFREWGFNLINMTDGGEYGIISDNCRRALSLVKRGQLTGFKHSEESKSLIKAKRALQIITEDHKRHTSESMRGIQKSEEHRKNISKSKEGVKLTKEHRESMSLSKLKEVKEITSNNEIRIWKCSKDIAEFYNASLSAVTRQVRNPNIKSAKLKSKFYYLTN